MASGWWRMLISLAIGAASLGAALYAQSIPLSADRLLAGAPGHIVPPPPELVPQGVSVPPMPKQLTAAQRKQLSSSLWYEPLSQKLVNLLYVDTVVTTGRNQSSRAVARILAALGWRFTQAQQNLMLHDALEGQFVGVLDHADALLRRQKLMQEAMQMLLNMEAVPQVHHLVVERLLTSPWWRTAYLQRIAPQTPANIIEARRQTMLTLIQSPAGVTRVELSEILGALVATGRGRAGYALWRQYVGEPLDNQLVYDPQFKHAAAARSEDRFPFEWHLNQNVGYSAVAGPQGAMISWDGRGVPVFMNQMVPVTPGARYLLSIEGSASGGRLQELFAPTLGCSEAILPFSVQAGNAGKIAVFQSPPVPKGCTLANLAIAGRVDTGARNVTINVHRITLRPRP